MTDKAKIDTQIYQATGMGSQRQRKLDLLKIEFKGAPNKAPTCAVPKHAPQTRSRWRGVGEVGSACEVRCQRRVQPGPFWKLAKGCQWVREVGVSMIQKMSRWGVCVSCEWLWYFLFPSPPWNCLLHNAFSKQGFLEAWVDDGGEDSCGYICWKAWECCVL